MVLYGGTVSITSVGKDLLDWKCNAAIGCFMDRKFFKGVLAGIVVTWLTIGMGIGICYYFCDGIGLITNTRHSVLGDRTSAVMDKMNLLKSYVDTEYMGDFQQEQMIEGIYKGMIESLGDPYSCYYTQKEYEQLMEDSNGVYCGIGATVTQDPDTGTIYVIGTFEGGSAYEAGITTGDIISKVDGQDVAGEDLTSVVGKMKGIAGTTVEVEFFIKKEKKYKTLVMERKQIEVPTVAYEMQEDGIGYIVVSSFDKPTDEQFMDAVEKLKEDGMKGLVIDLRNNGGGMLESVVNMLDYMVPEGKMLVYTKDKNGQGEQYKSHSKSEFTLPLVVLVNENTASASEVFAGAIQDYHMGMVVGTTSFGKGIVQSLRPLYDGTALKYTTSKYYTPDGRNIHGTGIVPDVEIQLDSNGKKDNQYTEAVRLLRQEIKQQANKN